MTTFAAQLAHYRATCPAFDCPSDDEVIAQLAECDEHNISRCDAPISAELDAAVAMLAALNPRLEVST